MKPHFALFLALLSLSGCLSLDPFLFKGEKLQEYLFDSYQGNRECTDALDSLPALSGLDTIRQYTLASGAERIAAVFLSQKRQYSQSDTAILYFHGTGPHIDYYWPRTRLLYATGHPVFIIDYRGFGMSTGQPTEDGIYQDGWSALRFLRDSLGNPRVILYAYSLGSMVGCELASKDTSGRICRLILEAPIGSVQSIVEDGSFLDLPGSYLTTYSGNNVEKIKLVTIPLLWIHGTNDHTLNREVHGLPVWNNYHGVEGYYIRVVGADHRTCPQTIGYNLYRGCVGDYIQGKGGQNPLLIAK